MNVGQLLEFHRIAGNEGGKFRKRRLLFEEISRDRGAHAIGIVGPRGTGKTVILKQIAHGNRESFYVSLDALDGNLFDLARMLRETMRMKLLLLDEVHYYAGFDRELKKIYDVLHLKVVLTSSTALGMYESGHDLSRRVLLYPLYPFSLREFAFFKFDLEFSSLTLRNLVEKKIPRDVFLAGEHFPQYIQGGLMPFALEEPQPLLLQKNILSTIIRKDIPRITRLATDELDSIERLVRFVGLSGIDGINYSSISQNIHVTKYKAEQYLSLLERAFVLRRVFPIGSNVLKEPKVVMALPYRLLYRPLEEALGGLREDFFVEAMRAMGKDVFYLKSMRGQKTPDYLIRDFEDVILEIGGKGKGKRQFKGMDFRRKIILSDDYDLTDIKRPLFLAGLLNG